MPVDNEVMTPADLRRRKLFVLAAEIGLTREERHDLAQIILRRDVTTWAGLDDDQVIRLLDAMEGFEKIVHILASRRHPSRSTIA